MGRLDGKVIVLSAAAQGIGRAAAIVMNTPSPQNTSVFPGCLVLWFNYSIILIVHIEAFSLAGVSRGL